MLPHEVLDTEGTDETGHFRTGSDRQALGPEAVSRDHPLGRGVNVVHNKIAYEAVAEAPGLESLEDVIPNTSS